VGGRGGHLYARLVDSSDGGLSPQDQLANFRAITDSKLGRLDVDDLLIELLERVRAIVDADTAAVLLLDKDAGDLVARAACGIEEEVRQGVRVPMGVGFAGRIARSKEPVRLDRVDSTTVSNPILWEKGIRTMLGVPLLVADEVIGVLHVGRLQAYPFDDADTELLQVVAERLAGAIQARQLAAPARSWRRPRSNTSAISCWPRNWRRRRRSRHTSGTSPAAAWTSCSHR
jgi:signal transduction protein with GAF and PtsI domain